MENPWTDTSWPDDDDAQEVVDLVTPSNSWSGVRWVEPSDAGSLWNNEEWTHGSSPSCPVVEFHDSVDFQTAPTTPTPQKQVSLPPSPTPPPSTRRGSPSEFNTFETADVNASFQQDSFAWPAQPWSPPADSQVQTRVDEWELAKLQKEKLDHHVPPELLASILEQLKELSTDLWPELEEGETRQPSKDFLTDVPGLKPAVDRLVPDDLVLSANVQFARTFTSKHMTEALRLIRHLPITLSSPLSIYMASKGSTAWETFVKSQQDMAQDDILPLGWRMVEKTTQEPTPTPEVKKKTGGLLSFFGLKSGDTTTELSPSSSRPASIVEIMKSPKSSLDGTSNPEPERRSSVSQSSALSSTSTSTFTSNASPTSQLSASSPNTEQGMAPSAVSRFFGRFSRSSTASSNSSRSLALSSDDIDFLGDIAPSAQDDADDDENLRGLTNVISAKSPSSLSATPLPQPLPPPPKFSRPGPGSSLQANSPFSFFDTFVDEQPLTAAEAKSIQSLVPTVPSTSSSTSWQMPKPTATPPIALNPRRKDSPQRRNFTAVMTSSGRSTPSNLQTPLPPLPPPPFTQLPLINPPQSQPQKQSTSLFDDDDFSAFLSPPAKAGPIQPLVQAASSNKPKAHSTPLIGAPPSIRSFPHTPSDHSSHHRKNSSKNSNHNLLDDEFDEFVSSPTLRTPTPPRPSSKMTGHINPPPPPPQGLRSTKSRDSLPPPPPPQKASRAAAHARTLSLLETAAARPGRWPAPPSPLPEAIAPPPPPPSTSSKGPSLNVFDNGDGEVVQTLTGGKPQTQTLAQWNANPAVGSSSGTTLPLRAISPPLVPNKVNGAAMAAPTASSNPSLWSLGANSGGKLLTPSAGSRNNKPTSGLSAQDLSFFEGL